MWAIIVSMVAALLGWVTLAIAAVWYWRTVVPDLYDDESVFPFVATTVVAGVLYLAIVLGAWRRFSGFRDGFPTMIVSALVLGALIISTLTTSGIMLIPSFIVATLAPALAAGGAATPKGPGT